MSKLGLFADVHIHPYARFSSVSERGLNTWIERALEVLEQIYTECEKRDIRQLVCLGDLFHAGARLNTRMFNYVYRFFESKKAAGFYTTLIAGNHDQLARSSNENALFCLKDVVFNVVSELVTPLSSAGLMMIPYTEDYDLIRSAFAKMSRAYIQPRILLGHLAIQGAVVGRHEFQPSEGCSPSWLDYVDLVLLGHYHKRQAVTKQVQYIGSAMAIDFNDANEQKGFTILDTESLETEFVPIETVGFRVIDVRSDQSDLLLHDDWTYTGDIVRVDHAGNLDEKTVRVQLLERGASAVLFKRMEARKVEQRVAVEDDDPRSAVRVYVDENHADLDGGRLYQLGNDIVATALRAEREQ